MVLGMEMVMGMEMGGGMVLGMEMVMGIFWAVAWFLAWKWSWAWRWAVDVGESSLGFAVIAYPYPLANASRSPPTLPLANAYSICFINLPLSEILPRGCWEAPALDDDEWLVVERVSCRRWCARPL